MFSLTRLIGLLGAACAITLHSEKASTALGDAKSLIENKKKCDANMDFMQRRESKFGLIKNVSLVSDALIKLNCSELDRKISQVN